MTTRIKGPGVPERAPRHRLVSRNLEIGNLVPYIGPTFLMSGLPRKPGGGLAPVLMSCMWRAAEVLHLLSFRLDLAIQRR